MARLGTRRDPFSPIAIAVFWRASLDGKSVATMIEAAVIGAVLMAYPVVMLRLKDKPYFRQTP